jgi:hypothetical protein
MITDVIVTWPNNCDYPLWRQFIHDNRSKFGKVIIGFHQANGVNDFSNFVREAMTPDNITFFNAPEPRAGIEDWRNLSINAALNFSDGDRVWFTEQDFFPLPGFWENVKELDDQHCQVITVYQGNRMHPCCIFMNREVLNLTRKNFGIVPDVSDHFSMIQDDIINLGVKVGGLKPKNYIHLNGLSQNWHLASIRERPNYELPKFIEYLKQCLDVSVPKSTEFYRIAVAVIGKYGQKEGK